MLITEKYFKAILADLIDENPIACRGILRISKVVFTEDVPSLAVSLSGRRPLLYVNLSFLSEHCAAEEHIKAVIIHEFLHVLLNHTEKFKRVTPFLNLALDAVINAIIHRSLGHSYSGMMKAYYGKSKGIVRLLRPITEEEQSGLDIADTRGENGFINIWSGVYAGELVVDDLLDLAKKLHRQDPLFVLTGGTIFLGNHEERDEKGLLSPETEQTLRETLSALNGGGIWRLPQKHGVGRQTYETNFPVKSMDLLRWEKTAIKALKASVTPDRHSKLSTSRSYSMSLPVLNGSDRRGFLRLGWNPILTDFLWTAHKAKPSGSTQIYLDVSGSMNEEMESLIALIWKLRGYIRFPFWAFSDTVKPAVIKDGKLKTTTSGGTSINSVLKHIAENKPLKAVVITDGYIEKCDPLLLTQVRNQQISAIISRDGSAAEVKRAGIPYVQLERYPS